MSRIDSIVTRILASLAYIISLVVFIPVSCTGGLVAGAVIYSKFDARKFEVDGSYFPFYVGVTKTHDGQEVISALRYKDAVAGGAYHLSPRFSRVSLGRGAYVVFEVLNDIQGGQIIKSGYTGENAIVVVVYKVVDGVVYPVSSEKMAPEYVFKALPFSVVFSIILLAVGRLFRNKL